MTAEPQTGQVTSPPASCWSNASAEANQPSKRCSLSHPKLNTITSASPQCGGVLIRPAGYRRVPVEAWPKNGNPMRDLAPPACLFAAIANQGAHDTAKFVAAPVPCAFGHCAGIRMCVRSAARARYNPRFARVMKLVNIADLKSAADRLTGSSPVPGTNTVCNAGLERSLRGSACCSDRPL